MDFLRLVAASLLLALAASCTPASTPATTPPADVVAPVVSSTLPLNLAVGVAPQASVSVQFSEAVNAATVTATTFILAQGSTPVAGSVTALGATATFTPSSALAAGVLYTATLSTGIQDRAGNALAANFVWCFTTSTAPDTVAPTVGVVAPANLATGVATTAKVSAQFSEALDPTTVTAATFTLAQGASPVSGAVTYSGTTALFSPSVALTAGTTYTATLTTAVKDLAGNALVAAKVWSFSTSVGGALGPSAVNLGTAKNYVILAESAISTNPASAIVGDLGLSPAALSFLTGFSHPDATGMASTTSSQVTGTLYAADLATPTPSLLTTAVGDMGTAYTDAAGRVTPDFVNAGTGEIGGLTLVPGLYNWTTGVNASTAVTLNGGPNDVWIFQIAGNLVVSNAVQVTLTGGALPKNIFWQVAGSTTLGTTSHFEGVLLCMTNVALQTGASMNGRIFAQTAVALDQNAVTQPAP